MMATIKVTTADGTNATEIGDAYAANAGVSFRDSVDRCDADGNGRVFLDCESDECAEFITEELENDERIVSYLVIAT